MALTQDHSAEPRSPDRRGGAQTATLPPRPRPEDLEAPAPARGAERRAGGRVEGALGRSGAMLLGFGALGLVALLSLALGANATPIGRTFDFVTGSGSGDDAAIIEALRVPRTLIGLAVGGALGGAGALIQGLTRNPLADPWILGLQAGAALGVVVAIYAFGVGGGGLAWFALAGAGVTWGIVFAIGSAGGSRATPLNLTLAGAAMAALLAALTSAITTFDAETLDEYRFWIVGSVAERELSSLAAMGPFLIAGGVLALLSGRALNGLSLGHDVARGLGQRVALTQATVALGVVLLAGAATAIAGPIAFVGLTVPHLARLITGPDYRWIVPFSAVFGALLVVTADVIGRVIVPPAEIQVGIMMAFLGAPVFIAFIRRRKLVSI